MGTPRLRRRPPSAHLFLLTLLSAPAYSTPCPKPPPVNCSSQDIDLCACTGAVLPPPPNGGYYTFRTSASLLPNCTVYVQGANNSILDVSFSAFRLAPSNSLAVLQPVATPADLLTFASGTTLPPRVDAYCGYDVQIMYRPVALDPHDPLLCDGVVGTLSTQPCAGAAAAGFAARACTLARSCTECASAPGCLWCDTGQGLCMYSGQALGAGGLPFTTPVPQAVCANASAFIGVGSCPDPAEAAAAEEARRARQEAAVLGGLSPACAPSAVAAAAALAATLAAAPLAPIALTRLWCAVIIGLYHVVSVLLLLVIRVRRTLAVQQGKAAEYALEGMVVAVCVVKLLEYYCIVLAQSLRVGDLPVTTLNGSDALLNQLATFAGDAQYPLLALVAYFCAQSPKGSKHAPCLAALLAAPAVFMGCVVGALMHFYRVTPLLAGGPAAAAAAGLPALPMQVCSVSTTQPGQSGAPEPFSMPVYAPALYVVAAAFYLLSMTSLLTAQCMGVAADDMESTMPLHLRPPLLRALGSIIAMGSQGAEVLAVIALRCAGAVTSPSALFVAVYGVPAAVQLAGLAVVLGACVWQVRLDSRVTPGTIKEGLRLRGAEKGGDEAGTGAGAAGTGEPQLRAPEPPKA